MSLCGSVLSVASRSNCFCRQAESRRQFAMVSEFLKNEVILGDQRRRLVTLLDGGEITKAKREPIPYQTKSAKVLSGGVFGNEVFVSRVFLKTHQNT